MRRNALRHASAPASRSPPRLGRRRDAAVADGELDRVGQIAVDRDAGGLEAEHEHALVAVARAGEQRLALVEDAAVRGPQAGLRELAQGVQRREQVAEHDARRRALRSGAGGTRIHASVITPSVPSEPSSRRSGDGPAPEPGRRHDA